MAALEGFWSYVQADDKADCERISILNKDVADQFELLTGEPISLFLDKDAIEWGDMWSDVINLGLERTHFFIPILTPRYFMSPECRRELQHFIRNAERLGIKDLILPILYVDVPALHEETPRDDLVALIKVFQWVDWRDLRFAEIASEKYRKGVFALAKRLVDANQTVEKAKPPKAIIKEGEKTPGENTDDSPGTLDQMAECEETLQELLPETLESLTGDIELIGTIMREGTSDIEKGDVQGKGFAARIVVARRIAKRLEEPTEGVWTAGNRFASQIHAIDIGVRIIIGQAPIETEEIPDSKTEFCGFFNSVYVLSEATRQSLKAVQEMIDKSAPLEKMSKDLRPPLRRLRQGLTTMVEAGEVAEEWVRLIKDTGIVCEGLDVESRESEL